MTPAYGNGDNVTTPVNSSGLGFNIAIGGGALDDDDVSRDSISLHGQDCNLSSHFKPLFQNVQQHQQVTIPSSDSVLSGTLGPQLQFTGDGITMESGNVPGQSGWLGGDFPLMDSSMAMMFGGNPNVLMSPVARTPASVTATPVTPTGSDTPRGRRRAKRSRREGASPAVESMTRTQMLENNPIVICDLENEEFKCLKCDKLFNNRHGLFAHVMYSLEHDQGNKQYWKVCEKCGELYHPYSRTGHNKRCAGIISGGARTPKPVASSPVDPRISAAAAAAANAGLTRKRRRSQDTQVIQRENSLSSMSSVASMPSAPSMSTMPSVSDIISSMAAGATPGILDSSFTPSTPVIQQHPTPSSQADMFVQDLSNFGTTHNGFHTTSPGEQIIAQPPTSTAIVENNEKKTEKDSTEKSAESLDDILKRIGAAVAEAQFAEAQFAEKISSHKKTTFPGMIMASRNLAPSLPSMGAHQIVTNSLTNGSNSAVVSSAAVSSPSSVSSSSEGAKKMSWSHDLDEHATRNEDGTYWCRKCDKTFKNLHGYKSHMNFSTEHDAGNKNHWITCEKCGIKVHPFGKTQHDKACIGRSDLQGSVNVNIDTLDGMTRRSSARLSGRVSRLPGAYSSLFQDTDSLPPSEDIEGNGIFAQNGDNGARL